MQKLQEKAESNVVQNINDVLFIDQQIISFNTYMPGKMLGSTLVVVNKTDSEQIIELSVD